MLKYGSKRAKGDQIKMKKQKDFQISFWRGRFYMLPGSYEISHGLCLNNFLKFWLIVNQIDQVSQFRYISQGDEVSLLVRKR